LFSSRVRNNVDRGDDDGNLPVTDRTFAEQLQRQWDEDEREAERLLKRKERRRWYEYYLQPYSMVSYMESQNVGCTLCL
jgi:hypothetical protein